MASIKATMQRAFQAFRASDFDAAALDFEGAARRLAKLCPCTICVPALDFRVQTAAAASKELVPVLANVLNALSVALHRAGRSQAAADTSAALLKLLKQHEMATEEVQLNDALFRLANNPDAALLSARKIRAGEKLSPAKYIQGLALFQLGQLDNALAAFSQVLNTQDSLAVFGHQAAGEVMFRMKRYSAALKSADDALRLQAKYPHIPACNALILKSKALNSLGRYKEGRAAAEKAAECGKSECADYLNMLVLKSSSRSNSAESPSRRKSGSQRSKSSELNMSHISDVIKKCNRDFYGLVEKIDFEGTRVNERHVIEAMKAVL